MNWYQKINPFYLLKKIEDLEWHLNILQRNKNSEIDSLISKLNAQSYLQEMVNEKTIELKQLRTDKAKLEKKLSQANKRNEIWFEFVMEYGKYKENKIMELQDKAYISIPLTELNTFLIQSVRYCLPRKTYAISKIIGQLNHYWKILDRNTKNIILNDIRVAVLRRNDSINSEWENFLITKQKGE